MMRSRRAPTASPRPGCWGRHSGRWGLLVRRIQTVLTLALLFSGLLSTLCGGAAAQSGLAVWGQPVNLSNSAAASDPLLVRAGNGLLYAYWWDRFDGVTVSVYARGRWSAPQVAPIDVPRVQGGRPLYDNITGLPVIDQLKSAPTLTADAAGRLHALWADMGRSTGDFPALLWSTLEIGSLTWSAPIVLLPSVTAWKLTASPTGALDLLFFEPGRTAEAAPGVYHHRSTDGGATWSARSLIAAAPYVRLATQGDVHLDLAADDSGRILATWDDPRTGLAQFAVSVDAGGAWASLSDADADELEATHAQLAFGQGGVALRLWQAAGADPLAGALQQRSLDGGLTWSAPEHVWSGYSLGGLTLRTLADGRILALAGGAAAPPTLALWDAAHVTAAGATGWSNPIAAQSVDAEQPLPAVSSWRVELSGQAITAIGRGAGDDVWVVRHLGLDDWRFSAAAATMLRAGAASVVPAGWDEPVALAAGGASSPTIVAAGDGRLQAFWWDAAAGLMTARYDGSGWGAAVAATIPAAAPEQAPAETPLIVDDAQGRVHALWRSAPDAVGRRALLHSAMDANATAWTQPAIVSADVLAWDAVGDGGGALHLLLLRRVESEGLTRGELAYTHVLATETTWAPPQTVYVGTDDDLPLAPGETLSLASAGAGALLAAWADDTALGMRYATSGDGGQTWGPAALLSDAERLPRAGRAIALGTATYAMVWASDDALAPSGWYQQQSSDGGITWDAPAWIMAGRPADMTMRLAGATAGLPTIVLGEGGAEATLSVWSAARAAATESGWSAARSLGLGLFGLTAQRVAVGDRAVAAIGLDADGRVWAVTRALGDLAWLVDPLPAWSQPASVTAGELMGGPVALAADGEGQFHALWSEADGRGASELRYARFDGVRWSAPVAVLSALGGSAQEPALAIEADQLHAVWADGVGGVLYHSSAFARDAYAAGSWAEPAPLPVPASAAILSMPRLVADLRGDLHVVYVAPLNEGRGVYYTRSQDGGSTWSAPSRVFDAAAAGWPMVTQPALAVDADGAVYVAWAQAGPTLPVTAQGVSMAYSTDEGHTWAELQPHREGAFGQPLLALSAPGVVHALWRDVDADAWWHRTSRDGGASWSEPAQVRGTLGLVGQVGLVSDWGGALHLLGLAETADGPALVALTWRDATGQWERAEGLQLAGWLADGAGATAALAPLRGALVVLLPGRLLEQGGAQGWVSALRSVPAVPVLPASTVIRMPTPAPTPTLWPTATPRPLVGRTAPTVAPLGSGLDLGVVQVPLLLLAGLGLGGVLVVIAILLQVRRTE